MRAQRGHENSKRDEFATEPRFAPAEETAPRLARLAEMQALGIGIRTLTNKLRQYGYAPRARTFGKAA